MSKLHSDRGGWRNILLRHGLRVEMENGAMVVACDCGAPLAFKLNEAPAAAWADHVVGLLAADVPTNSTVQPCRHDQGTDMHYDHVTCRACGWVCVDSSEHAWGRARNGWFPSKDAALEFKKYGTYPGYVAGSEAPARGGGFKCCGFADPPCTTFEASCQNPANYADGERWCPKCKQPDFPFCATSGCLKVPKLSNPPQPGGG